MVKKEELKPGKYNVLGLESELTIDFFDAVDGSTSAGDPIGNLWYTVACFVIAILCVSATFTIPKRNSGTADAELLGANSATPAT